MAKRVEFASRRPADRRPASGRTQTRPAAGASRLAEPLESRVLLSATRPILLADPFPVVPAGTAAAPLPLATDVRAAAVGSISGTVWRDANASGARDSGEPGLANWQVYLDADDDGVFDAGERNTFSDALGTYTFTDVQPGSHTVRQVVQPGFTQTFPTASVPSQYNIEVVFPDGSLTASQRAVFTTAASRWSQVITGDLPNIVGIDDLRITASAPFIDGVNGVLGQAGPDDVRSGSFLPYIGTMEFDSADVAALESSGQLLNVILHEMGHVIGVGTIWGIKGLLSGAGGTNPLFTGLNATAQYNATFGTSGTGVPVENSGGPGTRDSHWRESVLDTELMTGFLNGGSNPLSRITIGSLADLGYQVNYLPADPYVRPAPAPGAPAPHVVVVGDGQNVTGRDFGNRPPSNVAPTVGGLTDAPDPVVLGDAITLTATGVADADGDGTVTSVRFYRESNGAAGLQVGAGGDTLVGEDATPGPYSVAVPTVGLTPDTTYTYYARATDDQGAAGNAASAQGTVIVALASPMPGTPDLASVADTGASSADNVTNRDNSSPARSLTFRVPGTRPGALVEVLADGAVIGAAGAAGTVTDVVSLGTADLADGTRLITARQTEPGRLVSAGSAALPVTVDTAAPAVSAVIVSGSAWAGNGFAAALQALGLGDGTGYAVPGGAAQLAPLPWENVNRVTLRLTEPLAAAGLADLLLLGVTQPLYQPTAFDPGTLTWTLPAAIGNDRLQLLLAPQLADVAGNLLDGDWAGAGAGPDTFPSGDGAPGGDFVFRFNVLPGDVDRNGAVNIFDTLDTRNRQGTSASSPGTPPQDYDAFRDPNADAAINIFDTLSVRNRQGSTLPAADPPALVAAPAALTRFSAARITAGIAIDTGTDAAEVDELLA